MATFWQDLLREYEQWFASVSNMSCEDVERDMSHLEKTHARLGRVMRDLTKPIPRHIGLRDGPIHVWVIICEWECLVDERGS